MGSDPEIGINEPFSNSGSDSKFTKEDISQRKCISKKLLPNNVGEIEQIKIDELDALIAAYTAEKIHNNKVVCYGNEVDGFIYFPKR